MSEQKALTTKEDPVYQMLSNYKSAIASVLPKHMTPEKMLRTAYTVIHRTPKLKSCTPVSLINGILEISMLGLDIGRTAHLVPFKNEAVVIPDYKGLIELAHRSNQINSFVLKPVYENDDFDYREGTDRYIKHKPATENRGRLIAAYAIVNFRHGGFDFEVVHQEDIEAVKKVAPGAKSKDSPWNKPDQEKYMWMKTAARIISKRIPQSPELQKAAYLEELVEAGLQQNISHVIDADFRAMETPQEKSESNPEKVKNDLNKKLKDMKEKGQTKEGNQGLFNDPRVADMHLEFKKLQALVGQSKYYMVLGKYGYESEEQITDLEEGARILDEIGGE